MRKPTPNTALIHDADRRAAAERLSHREPAEVAQSDFAKIAAHRRLDHHAAHELNQHLTTPACPARTVSIEGRLF